MKKVLSVFDLVQNEDKTEYNFKPLWITAVSIIIVGFIVILVILIL